MGRPRRDPEAEKVNELKKRFGSKLVFTVSVKRPLDSYPWEVSVWDSELSVPIGVNFTQKQLVEVVESWRSMMEAGLKISKVYARVGKGA
jgi:hypothetical protein